jgi:lysophospholipase L1-like esterase
MIFTASGSSLLLGGAALHETVLPPAVDLNIVSHGDSMTRDNPPTNYIQIVKGLILTNKAWNAKTTPRGINGISYNYAWSGDPYAATMIGDGSVVDALKFPGLNNWLFVMAGTNGMVAALGNHSAATEYADFKTYIAARIAAGWVASRIVVGTPLPRTGWTDAVRQSFITSVVGDDGGYGYKVARHDLGTIGAAGADANTTYYYDGIHPTTTGHSVMGNTFYTAAVF